MLILSRNRNEQIRIGNDIILTIVEANYGRARIGIEAPKEVTIHREEIYQKIQREGDEGKGVLS